MTFSVRRAAMSTTLSPGLRSPDAPGDATLTRSWRSETFAGCILASPLGVDIDALKLKAMQDIYPADVCEFRRELAEQSLASVRDPIRPDVTICDPWTHGIAEWMPRARAS